MTMIVRQGSPNVVTSLRGLDGRGLPQVALSEGKVTEATDEAVVEWVEGVAVAAAGEGVTEAVGEAQAAAATATAAAEAAQEVADDGNAIVANATAEKVAAEAARLAAEAAQDAAEMALALAAVDGHGYTSAALAQASPTLANGKPYLLLTTGAFYIKVDDSSSTGPYATLASSARMLKVEAATGGPVVSLGRQMELDWDGIDGTVKAFYVARQLRVSIGATSLNGNYGTASTARSDMVALIIEDDDAAVIYLDLDDLTNPQKIANHPAVPPKDRPDKIVILAVVRNGNVVWSISPVLETTDRRRGRINLRYPVVIEKDKVLISSFKYVNRGEGIDTLIEPADGARYWEFDRQSSSGTEDRIVFDAGAWTRGETPVRRISGAAQPRIPTGNRIIEICSIMTREVHTRHARHGKVPGGLIPNLFTAGNDPDMSMHYSATDTTVVDVEDADLIALGFTRGISGASAFDGEFLPPDTPLTGFYAFRARYCTPTANDWGTPRVYVRGKSGVLSTVDLVMEKKISDHAAIFSLFSQYTYAEQPTYYWIGLFQDAEDGRVVCGAQAYMGPESRGWIARDDFPGVRRADVLYGPKHYVIPGRELSFVPSSIVGDPQREGVLSVSRGGGADVPYLVEARDSFKLDYDAAGDEVTLCAGGKGTVSGLRFERAMQIVTAEAATPRAEKILMIGDSVTQYGVVSLLFQKLAAEQITATFIGTLDTLNNDISTYSSSRRAEARIGWAFSDFTHKKTLQPAVALVDTAAYLNRSPQGRYDPDEPGLTRHQYNPFIRPSEVGDDAGLIKNGYVFDLRFYLDRFADAEQPGFTDGDPDRVVIALLTNDINEQSAAVAYQDASDGWDIMIGQTRAALPEAQIDVVIYSPPMAGASDHKWRAFHTPIIRMLLAKAQALGDPKLNVVSTWAHLTRYAGWSIGGDEDDSGQTVGVLDDELHPKDPLRQVIAEYQTAVIRCTPPV